MREGPRSRVWGPRFPHREATIRDRGGRRLPGVALQDIDVLDLESRAWILGLTPETFDVGSRLKRGGIFAAVHLSAMTTAPTVGLGSGSAWVVLSSVSRRWGA